MKTTHQAPVRITTAVVDGVAIEAGQKLVIEAEEGIYSFRYLEADGSLTCWGGHNQHESWRTFRASRCHMPGWVAPTAGDQPEKITRASRYEVFEAWALAHQGEVFTTQQLVDVAGFSAVTMVKYLKESLLFEQIKKGTWRVQSARGTRNDV